MSTNVNHSREDSQTMKNLPWIKKGKRFDRCLCFITVASLLTAAALTTALIGYHHRYNLELNQMNLSNVCLTPGCVKAASFILSSLDENIDPCNDFYRFACGEWLKTHHIPDDKSSVDLYDEAQEKLNLKLKILFETKLNGTEPSFFRMAKELYDTCMDVESIENAGAEPLKKVLKNLGGWPVVEGKKWDERKFDWLETLISLRKLGYSYRSFLSLVVDVDIRNTSRHIIILAEGSLGTDRTYLIRGLNDSITAAYYKKMVKAAILLGADENTAEKEMLEVLQLEMIIANYTLPPEEKRNGSKFDNKYTVKELQKMVPQIPWLKYINGFLINEIYEKEILNVQVPEFVKKIADLITRTEKRVIANYMLWSVIENSFPLLSKEWRHINLEYHKVLTGQSEEDPRWKQCLPSILDIAQNSYYIQHHFKDKTKDEVSKLVKYVFKEFLRILDEIDWMDEKTKTHAKAKANNMIFHIGYPEELLNNTAVMKYYQNLTISNDSYFENRQREHKWTTDYHFSSLRKPNDRTDWKKFAEVATEINAYYSSTDNAIKLPAGYIDNPFFSSDRPKDFSMLIKLENKKELTKLNRKTTFQDNSDVEQSLLMETIKLKEIQKDLSACAGRKSYLNFASIGATIGHEITHGFDDTGRQFDKDGNNVNWWEKVTDENFRNKAQCIIDQYSNYTTETGVHLNGVITQGENIADNGGLKESYWAYQSWVKDNGPEQLLPGLNYNQNQLFWIGAASLEWCAKLRPEYLNDLIISSSHSPEEFRVIGPLSNLVEFATDFNCPTDSPMNKKYKCQVW